MGYGLVAFLVNCL